MSTSDTGARGRTRRAILAATATVLGRDWSATLSEIAAAAEVGRTTLHRHFPDRERLIKAAVDDAIEVIDESVGQAEIERGDPREAMRRLVAAMVAVGDRIRFVFGDPRVLETYGMAEQEMPDDDPSVRLIQRGQAEGVFDPEVSPVWIRHVLWALLYTGELEADAGRIPRHGVTAMVLRTLERGVLTEESR